MDSKDIVLASIFASIYTALCYVLHPISFLAVQVRVACAVIPLIALFKHPALYGTVIGHLLVNISSPLGWLDLLAVPLFVPAKLAIIKYGVKATPLHVAYVAVYVGWMLHTVFGLPLLPSMASVGVGEAIAEIGLGVPLYYALKRRFNSYQNL